MRVLPNFVTVGVLAGLLCGMALAGEPKGKDDLVLPDSFGPFKLGMTLAEAKTAMPSLVVDENVFANSNPPVPFKFAMAQLKDQPFGDEKDCAVKLHFYRERFIYFSVLCPDRAATEAYLLKTYGPPGLQKPEMWQWTTHPRAMTFVPTSGAIAVADNQGTQAYQLEMFKLTSAAPQAPAAAPAANQPAAQPKQ